MLLRMLCVDLCLLHGFLGICLGVCGIYVSPCKERRYFLLNDFLDIASPSPAVDGGWYSMGGCSSSGMPGSSITLGRVGGGNRGGGCVDTTISESRSGDAMVVKRVVFRSITKFKWQSGSLQRHGRSIFSLQNFLLKTFI